MDELARDGSLVDVFSLENRLPVVVFVVACVWVGLVEVGVLFAIQIVDDVVVVAVVGQALILVAFEASRERRGLPPVLIPDLRIKVKGAKTSLKKIL